MIRKAIDKWLKAGVMKEGILERPASGTPQGGVISPILANIYLQINVPGTALAICAPTSRNLRVDDAKYAKRCLARLLVGDGGRVRIYYRYHSHAGCELEIVKAWRARGNQTNVVLLNGNRRNEIVTGSATLPSALT